MPKRWNFKKVIKRARSTKKSLPPKLAIIMKRHFAKSFRSGGFVDETFNPWKARKIKDSGRAILVKSSALRLSLRVRSASFKRIRVGSYGIKYARRHNRGLAGMPKRQFIGPSKQMTKKIKKLLQRELKSLFR